MSRVGRGLAPAGIELTEYGKIAEQQLILLEQRYSFVKVDRYVIMPDHIHAIIVLGEKTAGASPRPTLMDIVSAYKSLTTRECKRISCIKKLFQTSFYEHIIRDRDDYNACVRYILENPARWHSRSENE